jgi:hypothetical protein
VARIPPFAVDEVGSPLAARSLAFVDDQYLAENELAAGKPTEFRLIHRPTMAIIATRNGPKS